MTAYESGQRDALNLMKLAAASSMSDNPLRWSGLTADHADQIAAALQSAGQRGWDAVKTTGRAGLDALKNAPWKNIGYGALGAGTLAGGWMYGQDLFNEPFEENEHIPQGQY